MNILTINASPNGGKGTTALVLDPFLEGIRSAGRQVEVLYTKRLRIKPCKGEFNCQLKTPGVCSQKDDMQWILPKLWEADVMVLATPLYTDGMAGPLKNLLDRMLPLGLPSLELRDGHCRHPFRGRPDRKVVLVSNCGFHEMDNFDPLVEQVRAICRNLRSTFSGALLRPHGPVLVGMVRRGMPATDVLGAAK